MPIALGVLTAVIVVFVELVEVQEQHVGAGSRSLGRLVDQPEVAADRELQLRPKA